MPGSTALDLGYGDHVYVDGGYAPAARAQVAADRRPLRHACHPPARRSRPALSQPGSVRVVVSSPPRRSAQLPQLEPPGRSPISRTGRLSNYGCAVNSNLAAMIADPEDLVHGREGATVTDTRTAATRRRDVPLDAHRRAEGLQARQLEGRQVMNAPFQARAGLRDPFTAFVCDDATADMLRPVAVEHGWSPEKVNKGGLAQCGAVPVGLGQPEHPVRRPERIRRIRSTTSTRSPKFANRARS